MTEIPGRYQIGNVLLVRFQRADTLGLDTPEEPVPYGNQAARPVAPGKIISLDPKAPRAAKFRRR
ncbi:hypothetical protein [Halomonas sp. BC04]|uniref:hypothetical protein n=1 Tax=Halomonas sp. BC04 TaxID=1403540 RepID=UPI0003ED65EE|nr:hypothetical protein [Halomonas sp. BC04]EWG99944.1 hypothetical protein Q427_22310 [Halomonas sp. BC04]